VPQILENQLASVSQHLEQDPVHTFKLLEALDLFMEDETYAGEYPDWRG
jgi:hypothetical protein